MLAYILSNKNLAVKDILEFNEYEFKEDIEYSDKSFITVAKKPVIANDDFVFCKDENDTMFMGICETFESKSEHMEYSISLLQKENLFDRDIFVEREELIFNVGIEDFIVNAIRNNFISSGDVLMDKVYLSVRAGTHTPVAAKVDAEEGVYNLKTYLGNAKQYYGIFLEFDVVDKQLRILVHKREEKTVQLDTGVSDIAEYKETYSVSVLARLLVKWKIPDTEDEQGNPVIGAETNRKFFLLTNRTITENINHEERADGISKSVYIEAETEEEMLQRVYDEFSSNEYSHKVSLKLNRSSRLYPEQEFFVGRKCTLKTKSGIRTSFISKKEVSSQEIMASLTFGNLKVTLIEKLRR